MCHPGLSFANGKQYVFRCFKPRIPDSTKPFHRLWLPPPLHLKVEQVNLLIAVLCDGFPLIKALLAADMVSARKNAIELILRLTSQRTLPRFGYAAVPV